MWKKRLGILLIVAACGSIVGEATRVQAQDERFVPVTEGLLDTETGLVWGHTLAAVDSFLGGNSGGSFVWEEVMLLEFQIDYDGDGQHDEVISYQDFSNSYYGREDTDWRIPTIGELEEAVNAGLMLHLDMSPEPGVQLFDPETDPDSVWSSTEGGKKRGKDSYYMIELATGQVNRLYLSLLNPGAIPVRGASAPVDGGNPGKGKKK